MWECTTCHEAIDEPFDACWKCGTSQTGAQDPNFAPVVDVEPLPVRGAHVERPQLAPLVCVRCSQQLDFMGTKKFHEGMRIGFLGEIAELLVNREHFDMYCCPRCGRLEMFADGVGEKLRPG